MTFHNENFQETPTEGLTQSVFHYKDSGSSVFLTPFFLKGIGSEGNEYALSDSETYFLCMAKEDV